LAHPLLPATDSFEQVRDAGVMRGSTRQRASCRKTIRPPGRVFDNPLKYASALRTPWSRNASTTSALPVTRSPASPVTRPARPAAGR